MRLPTKLRGPVTEPTHGGGWRMWEQARGEAELAVPGCYEIDLWDRCFAEPTHLSIRKPDCEGRMVPQVDIEAAGDAAYWRVRFQGPRGGNRGTVEVETLGGALEVGLEWLARYYGQS